MRPENRTLYFALVEKDEHSAYGVTFPDLPGCFAASDTEDDILANAMEALELYADDMDKLPAPKGMAKLKSDNTIANELAKGAWFLAVPLIRNTQKTERVNITLNKGLLDAIDHEAARRKMTRSGFLAQAAEREIGG